MAIYGRPRARSDTLRPGAEKLEGGCPHRTQGRRSARSGAPGARLGCLRRYQSPEQSPAARGFAIRTRTVDCARQPAGGRSKCGYRAVPPLRAGP